MVLVRKMSCLRCAPFETKFSVVTEYPTSTIKSYPTSYNSENMPLLRPQLASRVLRPELPKCQHVIPGGARWASKTSGGQYEDRTVQPAPKSDASTSPAPTPGDSAMIREEGPEAAIIGHQPDYHAPIDHGTS